MSKKISFKPESSLGRFIGRWWTSLDNDRGARAELRRAHNITAVAFAGAYQRFYRQAVIAKWPENAENWQKERLAAAVALLAHVKFPDEKEGRTLPMLMSEGERPVLSELRFRRLLEAPTLDELFIGLRRALPIIGYKANIYGLANDIYYWGDKTRKKWAYDYKWPTRKSA